MSLTASRRLGPLSASSQARPKPVEPRTFGSTTAYPSDVQKRAVALHVTFADAGGPPWRSTIVGARAALAGTYRFTGTSAPSKLLTVVVETSIGGSPATPGRFSSRRNASAPVLTSRAKISGGASAGARGPVTRPPPAAQRAGPRHA